MQLERKDKVFRIDSAKPTTCSDVLSPFNNIHVNLNELRHWPRRQFSSMRRISDSSFWCNERKQSMMLATQIFNYYLMPWKNTFVISYSLNNQPSRKEIPRHDASTIRNMVEKARSCTMLAIRPLPDTKSLAYYHVKLNDQHSIVKLNPTNFSANAEFLKSWASSPK